MEFMEFRDGLRGVIHSEGGVDIPEPRLHASRRSNQWGTLKPQKQTRAPPRRGGGGGYVASNLQPEPAIGITGCLMGSSIGCSGGLDMARLGF